MKVGPIGLGIIGKPMSKNLLEAGYELVVFDFNKGAVNEVVGYGAVATTNSKEVTRQYEVVIIMVPNSPHVCIVVLGENGVAESMEPGAVVVGMSSVNSTESGAIGVELAKLGIDMLDVPVSGGEPKVIGGTLSAMMGGRGEFFGKYYDIPMVMAGSAVHVDELGLGGIAKLANQIAIAVSIAAVSEALTFAKKAGTDPELVYQTIRSGLTGFTAVDAKAFMILNRNFKPGFCTKLHIKDLNNVLNAAHAISSPVPLTGQLMEIVQDLKTDGYEKEDHSSVAKYYEEIANTTVES